MEELYKELFDDIHASDRLRQEVMSMTKQERRSIRKRISRTTLIAAAMAVLLAGTAVAAALPGGTIIWLGSGEKKNGETKEEITGGILIPEDGGEPIILPPEAYDPEPEKPVETQPEATVPEQTGPEQPKLEEQPAPAAPDTLPGLHEKAWEEQKGQASMTESQKQLIESLTVPVNASVTQSGVTVTVDTVTVGDRVLWALLKINGDFDVKNAFRGKVLDAFELHFYSPAGEEWRTRQRGFGSDVWVPDGQGGLTTTLVIDADFEDPAVSMQNGCTVEASFTDIIVGGRYIQGTWTLRLDVPPVEKTGVLTVDSAEVAYLYSPPFDEDHPDMVLPDGKKVWHRPDSVDEERFTTVRNIKVSVDGVRYTVEDSRNAPSIGGLILADGTEIGTDSISFISRSSGKPERVYYWQLPVDLTQVVALRFSEEGSGSTVKVRDTVVPLR